MPPLASDPLTRSYWSCVRCPRWCKTHRPTRMQNPSPAPLLKQDHSLESTHSHFRSPCLPRHESTAGSLVGCWERGSRLWLIRFLCGYEINDTEFELKILRTTMYIKLQRKHANWAAEAAQSVKKWFSKSKEAGEKFFELVGLYFDKI